MESSFRDLIGQCWFLTGATASGKSRVGLELAQRLGAEIISLDSMAIYRGMDIGTAKPSRADRGQVVHHLIDIVDPNKEYSVSQYLEQSEAVVRKLTEQGKPALFVGGTPLYLKVLLRGLFTGPPADWEFRRQVAEELETVGRDAVWQRLKSVDPLLAAKLHPNDTRRIIRALEVARLQGEPLSHLQMEFEQERSADQCRVFVLQWPRELVHQRINNRVQAMFAGGLLDEVKTLLEKYKQLGRTASQAVGYREAIEHLRGEVNLEETIEAVKTRTRRFARRQETWFRSLSECRYVPVSADTYHPQRIAEEIVETP